MWLVMIILHSIAGAASFAVAAAALAPNRLHRHPWLPPALLWILVAMVVAMAGAMAAHWTDLDIAAQAVFSGLLVLGLYMLHRARRARTLAGSSDQQASLRYIDDVGFVLIALFDGFVIVTALDLGAPLWLIATLAVLAVAVGHRAITRAKSTALARPGASPHPGR